MIEAPATTERASWSVAWSIHKYHEDIDGYRAREGAGFVDVAAADAAFFATHEPYEVIDRQGNLLLNSGIGLMLDLLIGAGGTVFSNANAYLGVGDSNTAASAGQTDLQAATNKLRKAMDATYPTRTGQTLTFRATFGGSDANFAWQEWIIANAASAGTALNRKVESNGTKASGATWVFTVSVTIS